MSTAAATLKQVRVSMMNAIHDLPLLSRAHKIEQLRRANQTTDVSCQNSVRATFHGHSYSNISANIRHFQHSKSSFR